MTPYGPQQPVDEQAMALPNPQAPASLSTFQLPQPEMPEVQGPGPAAPPATLGGLPDSAPPMTMGNELALAMAKMQANHQAAEERAAKARADFEESMKTASLERYLPKPSARQMLSDALTNIGLAHLTKGQFTPIQQRRFDEALKAHQSEVQDKKLALDSANSAAQQLNNTVTQMRLYAGLSDKNQYEQGRLQQAANETERKRQATQLGADFKAAHDKLVGGRFQSQNELDAARKDYYEKLAAAKGLGSNAYETANSLVSLIDPAGEMPGEQRVAKFQEFFKQLTGAAHPQNANSGWIGSIRIDGDGQPRLIRGNKITGELDVPKDVNFNKFSDEAKKTINSIRDTYSLGSQLMDVLEQTKVVDPRTGKETPLKDVGGDSFWGAVGASATQRLRYQQYIRGIGNTKDSATALNLANQVQESGGNVTGNNTLDTIIQYAALLRIMGAQPFMRGIRNQQYVNMIMVHLPNEKWDNPAFMYEKLENMMKQWKGMQESVIKTQTNPTAPLPERTHRGVPSPNPAPQASKGEASTTDGLSEAARKLLKKHGLEKEVK